MILEELYKNDWHQYAAYYIGASLENFYVTSNTPREDRSKFGQNKQGESLVILNAEESLKIKPKSPWISYHERIYLYSILKKGQQSLARIAIDHNISIGTLYKFKKEFDLPAAKLMLEKPITYRNLTTSPKIQKLIFDYLNKTRIP